MKTEHSVAADLASLDPDRIMYRPLPGYDGSAASTLEEAGGAILQLQMPGLRDTYESETELSPRPIQGVWNEIVTPRGNKPSRYLFEAMPGTGVMTSKSYSRSELLLDYSAKVEENQHDATLRESALETELRRSRATKGVALSISALALVAATGMIVYDQTTKAIAEEGQQTAKGEYDTINGSRTALAAAYTQAGEDAKNLREEFDGLTGTVSKVTTPIAKAQDALENAPTLIGEAANALAFYEDVGKPIADGVQTAYEDGKAMQLLLGQVQQDLDGVHAVTRAAKVTQREVRAQSNLLRDRQNGVRHARRALVDSMVEGERLADNRGIVNILYRTNSVDGEVELLDAVASSVGATIKLGRDPVGKNTSYSPGSIGIPVQGDDCVKEAKKLWKELDLHKAGYSWKEIGAARGNKKLQRDRRTMTWRNARFGKEFARRVGNTIKPANGMCTFPGRWNPRKQ